MIYVGPVSDQMANYEQFAIQFTLNCAIIIKIQQKLMKFGKQKKRTHPAKEQTQLYDVVTKIQTQILEKIQKLKNKKKVKLCQHYLVQSEFPPEYDEKQNYFDLFWKRYLLNGVAMQKIQQIQNDIDYCGQKLQKIERLFEKRQSQLQPYYKSKNKRPKFKPVQYLECNICKKTFSDQLSLRLHLNIKHDKQPRQSNEQVLQKQEQNEEQELYLEDH